MSSFLRDIPEEQLDEIAAYLDQGPSYESVVDRDGNDSLSDEYWRRLIKRLAKVDKKHVNLLDKSYIRDLEKEAWELKSPSKKLLETLKNPNRGLELDLFRSCLEHKDVKCIDALKVLKEGTQSPIIVTEPEDCEVEAGGQLKLVCKVKCSYPRPQYQWFNEQQALPNSNTDTYRVPKVDESHAGQYTCRVCIGDLKKAFMFSRTVQVTVTPPPAAPIQETSPLQVMVPLPPPTDPLAITTQPQSLNVQWGSEAVLSCRAKGPPGQMVTYQWYKSAKALTPDTIGDLRIPQVTCEDEGQYYCVVSCGNEKAYSKYVDVHVQLEEADCIEITRHSEDVQVRVNDTITLSCEARNKAGKELVYEWFMGGKKVGCGSSYQFTAVQRAKYYCRVSLKDKDKVFVKSKQATITVVSLWFAVQPQNVNGYVGERVILWCHAENITSPTQNITSPTENITYDWLKSVNKEGPFKTCLGSDEVLVIESLTDKHPGYYKCQANGGSITSDIVYVGAKLRGNTDDFKLPEICFTKQPRSWALEPERSFTLICEATASKGDVTYQWIKDGSVLPKEQKSELRRMSAKLSDFGSYYCLVRTVEGGAVALSDTARVEIAQKQQLYKTDEGHYAQEKVALLIGNGSYKNMEQLDGVETDIKDLQRSLTNLNFRVFSLLDLKYDEMLAALEQFYKFLQPGVYAVFYFSGHGFRYNEVTYLMPIDAASNPVMCDSNISAKTIKYNIQNMSATGLILLDCCAVSEGHLKIQGPKNNTTSLATQVENHCEISACLEGSPAYMHTFNKALVECLKMKITFHELAPAIKEEMKKKMVKQSPTMTGLTLEKVSLHDPIKFGSEDAARNSDLLLERHTRANSAPEVAVLNVNFGHPASQVQLCLRFSAEFSNILNVEVCPLPSSYDVSFSVDEKFIRSQGVDICRDESNKFRIIGVQRVKDPLKLRVDVTVTQDMTAKTVIHEFKNKVLFGSLL